METKETGEKTQAKKKDVTPANVSVSDVNRAQAEKHKTCAVLSSGSRHTRRPFPFYVQRFTAHGLSTDDTHGSRAVDIMCNRSGSVQQYNAMTTDTRAMIQTTLRVLSSGRKRYFSTSNVFVL